MKIIKYAKAALLSCMLICSIVVTSTTYYAGTDNDVQENKGVTQYMDCFKQIPIVGKLDSECWGAKIVGARDQSNGLEDKAMSQYSYWDGGIVKNEDNGKYYMFASRWNQAGGHWGQDGIKGWEGSQAIYAVSDNLYGPYEDKGPLWPDWCEGAGHNVFIFKVSEKDSLYTKGYRYAISISDTGLHSETANGTIHISKSLEGPWELVENKNNGKLKVVGGEFSLSNVSIMVRPDGLYETVNRNGDLAIGESLTSEFKIVQNGLWNEVPGLPSDNVEDPVIWYYKDAYHIICNKWDSREAFYLTSKDGKTDWKKENGLAYSPNKDFLKYTDGTANKWTKLERPSIYMEDGKFVAMTFAVVDVQKESDMGNDQHGSKVIVVPFDSDKLEEVENIVSPLNNRTGISAIADTTAQSYESEAKKNYGSTKYIQLQKSNDAKKQGMGLFGEGSTTDTKYDNKLGYVRFDLSQLGIKSVGDVKSVKLSLVYLNKPSGNAINEQIQVALADSTWDEATMTWGTQPKLSYDANNTKTTTAISKMFKTSDMEKEVLIDVTSLVKKFLEEHPDETNISFALNATLGDTRIRIGSREAGSIYEPKLQAGEAEEVTTKMSGTKNYTEESEDSSNGSVFAILGIVGGVLVIVAVVVTIVVKKKKNKDK